MTPVHRSYLDRYLAGQHVAVWEQLVALGADVRHEPTYSDARAVARETMTRVRHNVELLASRLRELGFRFLDPEQVIVAPDAELLARLDRLEADVGPIPIAVRAFFEQVGSVNFMGSHPRLSEYAAMPDTGRMASQASSIIAEHPTGGSPPAPNLPPSLGALLGALQGAPPKGASGGAQQGGVPKETGDFMALARQLTQRLQEVREDTARAHDEGKVPERLRANAQLAEAMFAGLAGPLGLRAGAQADQPGAASEAASRDVVSDPLVVEAPAYDDLEEYRELGDPGDPEARDDEGWTGRYLLEFAPDALHKANISGGSPYAIAFPDPAADAPVLELDVPYARTFVGYLRECFRWGGFPGLAARPDPPTAELARLTDGLLPI